MYHSFWFRQRFIKKKFSRLHELSVRFFMCNGCEDAELCLGILCCTIRSIGHLVRYSYRGDTLHPTFSQPYKLRGHQQHYQQADHLRNQPLSINIVSRFSQSRLTEYLSYYSAVAIIETVMFSVLPNSFYTFALDFVMGKRKISFLHANINSSLF